MVTHAKFVDLAELKLLLNDGVLEAQILLLFPNADQLEEDLGNPTKDDEEEDEEEDEEDEEEDEVEDEDEEDEEDDEEDEDEEDEEEDEEDEDEDEEDEDEEEEDEEEDDGDEEENTEEDTEDEVDFSSSDCDRMTKKELIGVIDDYGLDIDLAQHTKLAGLRKSVKLAVFGPEPEPAPEPTPEPTTATDEGEEVILEKGDEVIFKKGRKDFEGEITKVNDSTGKVTVRTADGKSHKLDASAVTVILDD
jgi:hypothetical protein